jgi:hypothetical protein
MTYYHDDVAGELGRLDEDYKSAPIPDPNQRSRVPDGTYQAKIKNLAVKRSKGGGKLMLEWWLTIEGPEFKGTDIPRWNHFDTTEKLGWLKKDLAICGLELDRLATLEAKLPALLDKVLEIQVQTRTSQGKEYVNVYFNRLVDIGPKIEEAPF